MGQYYIAAVFPASNIAAYDISNPIAIIEPSSVSMFSKLTEHSWIGNRFVMEVERLISLAPSRVMWIGDYFKDVLDPESEFDSDSPGKEDPFFSDLPYAQSLKTIPKGLVESIANVHNKKNKYSAQLDEDNLPDLLAGKYLINWTQEVYVPMDKYIKLNAEEDGSCLHPLSLLTACGNERGGGDYYGINKHLIGDWAFDVISLATDAPKEYDEFIPEFSETREFRIKI